MKRQERTWWAHRPTLDNLAASICFYAEKRPDDNQLGALLLKLGLDGVNLKDWTGEQKDEAWHLLWKLDCRVMDGKRAPNTGPMPMLLRGEYVTM